MSKSKFQVAIIGFLALGAVVYFTATAPAADPIPAVTQYDDYSTLTCSGAQATSALSAVLEAYASSGDIGAYQEAEKAIQRGICEYDNRNSLSWLVPGEIREGFEKYTPAECTKLSNGYCVAIQPVYVLDSTGAIEWSGYMLVAPRIATGTRPTQTVVSRPQKGLVMDMNF